MHCKLVIKMIDVISVWLTFFSFLQSDMGKLNEEFSSVMLSGQGSSAQWQQMPILNAAGVETNKVLFN
jgi:hypothetical protein